MTQEEIKQAIEAKQAELEAKTAEVEQAVADENVELSQSLMNEAKAIQAEIDELKAQIEVETKNESNNFVANEERSEVEADSTTVEATDVKPEDEVVEEAADNKDVIIADLEAQIEELKNKNTQNENGEKRSMTNLVEEVVLDNQSEVRDAFTHYIQTGEKRVGLTTESGAVVVPTEVAKEVVDYTNDVTALANLVQVKKVSNGQGEIAFFDGTAVPALPAVAELEQNPMLGIQPIKKKQFKVETYRGYFPVSKEAIEDGIGAIELVKSLLNESVVATQNKLILDIMNAKEAVSVTDADGLKKILNVDLAPKYRKHLVVSQSAYNNLDTLKDGNGRYLLQDSITAQSGKQLFGMQVTVVEDAIIGENTMYVGDLAAAVGLVDRSRYEAQWTSYMQFAECLMVAVRLDAIELNPKAAVKVTFAPTV
ncbi:phage major capsid protein [Macrococcus carouselicus]|uniref:Phage major capsid protein n=1 Tax=Macrococcus carouselicus TaxID=69969 RepID=A0A9Q8CKW7_9STAP|nr:phage major capsid protein [Macrococcus carouselicus]TDM04061.1 phage major capsid protein [Macrococcus carouselicus]